ncbi:Global nitrogen regulator NrpRII [uncultured archaeon]|nr:Global nitrogen regulator NrpRII [uncultured archaeon]
MNSPQPLVFTLARIENLMQQVSFDPAKMMGKIITNTSLVNKEDIGETLAVFYDTIQSGLSVSPMIRLVEEGEKVRIKTACSLSICGILLKRGIPVRPKGGGLIEVVEREPTRFTDMLMYWATTIDPIDVLTVQGLTDILGMMRTGNGRILGNLQEAPMVARDRIEETLEMLASVEFTGVLELGEPNMDVLGVSVERDHVGISLVGGTNLVAAARECKINVEHESISDLTDISLMKHIDELI